MNLKDPKVEFSRRNIFFCRENSFCIGGGNIYCHLPNLVMVGLRNLTHEKNNETLLCYEMSVNTYALKKNIQSWAFKSPEVALASLAVA